MLIAFYMRQHNFSTVGAFGWARSLAVPTSYATMTTAPVADYMGYFLENLTESSLKGDPGIISIYCNDGFTLAQALVEKVSGLSYSDYLSKNILTKAGMNNTSCYFKEGNTNVALYYKSDGTAADLEYVNSLGAGGIASNAQDLCKYGSQTVPSGTPKLAFGLGWDSVNDEAYQKLGVRSIYKSGDTSEYHSMLYLLPDQNITIALTFSGSVDTTAVTDVIVKTLLAEKGVIPTETAETVPTAKPAPVPDNLIAYAGYYTLSGNILKVDFNQAAGEMNIYSNSDTGFTLVDKANYHDDGYFYGTDNRLTLEENFGTKFLMEHTLTGINGSIKATMIPPLSSSISPAQFVDKTA